MDDRANAFLRHRQARWLRPDAARWVRPDAAKFVKPGTDAADVYPALAQQRDLRRRIQDRALADAIAQERAVLVALRGELAEIAAALAARWAERKYNQDQPRVPAGNSDGGQWTSGSGGSGRPRVHIYRTNPDSEAVGDGGFDFSLPMGSIDFGDIASEIDKLDLFDIKPPKPRTGGVRLAGPLPDQLPEIVVRPGDGGASGEPGIGHNGGPPLGDPPDIPRSEPVGKGQTTAFLRAAGRWVGRAIGLGIAVDFYVGHLNNEAWLDERRAEIETYRDPPRTYEELMEAVQRPRRGTEKHHTAEQTAMERFGFSRREINAPENLVRIPTLKHYDITAWYGRPNKGFAGLTPRQYLADKPLSERMRVGREALILYKVLKP